MMSLLFDFAQWCSNLAPMVFVRDSRYGMPALQSVHLVGLTVLLASILMLDLRVVGVGLMDWSPRGLEQQLKPWALGAATMVLVSGAVIFLGTPSKYVASNPFRVKMAVLCLAIAFQVGVRRRFVTAEAGAPARRGRVVAAGLSLTLWFLVGWAGRAIAFVP